jgi:hypothetical protein
MSKSVWIAVTMVGALVSGCSIARYPVLPAWSADAEQGKDCAGLRQELDAAQRTERQIAEIAAGRGTERPTLYSTVKSDADRAVQARLVSVEAALKSKACLA